MIVTDARWKKKLKNGWSDWKIGYFMDRWLVQNLEGIENYLGKAFDVVGIVSGHGKVRIGKSTMAMQVAYYIAWVLAGGKMIYDDMGRVKQMIKPSRQVNFNLEENVVFTPDDLKKKADELFHKYGKNQVIVYDEGRAGLDSSRAMESLNKGMMDFFQECGFYGHVILIVLPNFFKLQEEYAVARSLFLIDVFADKNFNRGYFNFYNERQKEYLYFWGKRKIGVTARYNSAKESFWGHFGQFMPFDKELYEKMKSEAIKRKKVGRLEAKAIKQRNAAFWLLNKVHDWGGDLIAREVQELTQIEFRAVKIPAMIAKIDNDLSINKKVVLPPKVLTKLEQRWKEFLERKGLIVEKRLTRDEL